MILLWHYQINNNIFCHFYVEYMVLNIHSVLHLI